MNSGPCAEAAEQAVRHYGIAGCSSRHEYGESKAGGRGRGEGIGRGRESMGGGGWGEGEYYILARVETKPA